MARRDDKLTRAAHIKRHTKGTSNEISFSVLDAAREALDGGRAEKEKRGPFGHVSLFTLPARRKKPSGTPTKEKGLPLSTGDFVSVDDKEVSSRFDAFDFAAPTMGGAQVASSDKARRSRSSSSASAVSRKASIPSKPVRSPEEEIALRKARRKLSKVVAAVVISLTMVVLLSLGGMYLYNDLKSHQSNVAQLDEALDLVNQADEVIVELDDVISHPFDEGMAQRRKDVYSQLESASLQLNQADEKARASSLNLNESRDKEAANQTVAAIAARRSLIESGAELLKESSKAETAAINLRNAWNEVLRADSLARDAAKLVKNTTAENVQASKDKTNEALAAFNTAYSALSEVQRAYGEADMSALFSYVEKRIESLGYAIASDDAFLAKNKEEASAQNEAYNVADAEAVALAKAIPEKPETLVYEAYEQVVSSMEGSYSTARLQAGTADAFIRDYLGAESK